MGSKSNAVVATTAVGFLLCSSFPHVFSFPRSVPLPTPHGVRGVASPEHYSIVPDFHQSRHQRGFHKDSSVVTKPSFSYEYGVADEFTGDMKAAYERRDGDFVEGGYQVLQPDGILRVVTYTSDPFHGFRTKIQMLNGLALHPLPFAVEGKHHRQTPASTNHAPTYYPEGFPVKAPPHVISSSEPTLSRNLVAKTRKFNGKRTMRFAKGFLFEGNHQSPHFKAL